MKDKNIYNDEHIFNEYLKYRQDKNSPHSIEVKPAIINLVGNFEEKSILDVGCGSGDFAYYFAKNGAKRVVGIDISERAINYANINNKNKLTEYKNMNIYDVKNLNEKFDIIISDIVLNYVNDLELSLKNIYNLLEKKGLFVFSQIHPFSTAPLNGRAWSKNEDGSDYYHLSDYGKNGLRETNYFGGKLEMFHRTFAEIINTIINSGFEIIQLIEPTPSKELLEKFPDRIKEIHKPSFLIMKLTKK